MLILSRSPRPLSFCMAASSYSKPIIGYFAKKISVIPVLRPEDSKILGKGKLRFLSKRILQSEDAEFISQTKNYKLGIQYILLEDNTKIYIDEILSENKLKIKENQEKIYNIYKDNISHLGKYYIIPKLDNTKMFSAAYEVLKEGKAICIFPEGTSHDRSNFIKLKAGVALMSLGGIAENDINNIQIISAGLSYFKRDQFRSEVVLEFGKPYIVPKELCKLYKKKQKRCNRKNAK